LAADERFVFHRLFVVGLYKGSMRRLLLRADKTDVNPTRIDVLFQDTQYMRLPTVLEGLEIADVTHGADGRAISAETGIAAASDTRLYRIVCGAGRGLVVAGAAAYLEDTGEYWAPSGFQMDP
jgi:hypothetical protein